MKMKLKVLLTNALTAIKQINSNPVSISEGKQFQSTGTGLTYTGVYFTVPANCYYAVVARATYTNVQPKEIAINTSSTNANANIGTGTYAGVMCTAAAINYTGSSPVTLYVWAKYASANSAAGRIWLEGFYIRSGMGG